MAMKNNNIGICQKVILDILDFGSLKIYLAVLFLLFFMFWYADSNGLWPTGPWGVYEGNHGPWRGFLLGFLQLNNEPVYILRRTLTWIFELQLIALILAAASLLFRRTLNRIILLGLNSLYFNVLMYIYYWLID